MANYNGVIIDKGCILGTVRNIKKSGNVIPSDVIVGGFRSTVKQGLDLNNYYFSKFERIPKERILNRFKNLSSNIHY
ncbi:MULTISPECIES: hypothetical protein [unclassified Clostridium]|uniref:hypothetical protein n=1 Tax=unclassified Clostridium TaxID=2614128 RepID=UPI0002E1189A|nr:MULTISPECIES: hypothetical protein [unclassified Clostridium]